MRAPMRITFLMPADDLTGGNRVVGTYAKLLRERGHEVLVVSNAHDRPSLRERVRALRAGRWRELQSRMRPPPGHIALSGVPHRVLERPRPMTAADLPDADVLIATWWETAVWMQRMPASKGRKVHLIQGYEVWTGGDVRARVHDALRLPNRKIAISASLARDVEAELGDLGISVVPNAVDLEQFDASPRPRGEPPTAGFIYAHARFKGADTCIRACELARRELPDLRVLAFGGDLPSRALPLPAGAEFVHRPAQDRIASLYAQCDVWLFGSRLDSFGLPILEAMACRTPVVGVPVGAAPDLLADGGGTLVPAESPEAMAAAIVALCRGPEGRWRRASELAHARAHGYSWDDAATRLLAVLAADGDR
jgi:glycosyltransferase involved in cell wall biosynthesis